MKRETRRYFTPPKPRDIVKVDGLIGTVKVVDEVTHVADVYADGSTVTYPFGDITVIGSKGD